MYLSLRGPEGEPSYKHPYLAVAALLAAGLHGIERELEPPAPFTGNAYRCDVPRVPGTLREAAQL
jgi:glutamine synthetase